MSCTSCHDIAEEIILHEILGSSGGEINNSLLAIDNGILWIYDEGRGKWLSSFRSNFASGEKGRAKNKYLLLFDGQASNLSGYRLTRDATITAVTAQTKSSETWTLHIRKNNDPTNIVSLSMSAAAGNHTGSANIDLVAGDRVQLYAETTSFFGISDPTVWVEIAWRNSVLPIP
jgi:hypothetical protein